MPAAQVEVQLGEQRPGIVGAADRPEFVIEEARPAGLEECVEPFQVRQVGDPAGRLFGFDGRLLVVGEEEERPVAREGAAQGGADLVPPEIRFPASSFCGVLRRDLVPLAEVVARAGEVVGPRLGDDADEAARRAAELGGGSLVHDDQLADGVLVERERGTLSAALFPEEGVVEVGAVHDEVVEDAALSVDVQFVAVRPLGDGRPGREQRQVHEVAAVARHRIHHLFPEPLGAREVRGFDRGRQLAEDRDRFRGHDAEVQVEVEHLPHPQDRPLDALGPEPARRGDGEVVGARRQQTADELPVGRRFDAGDEIGAAVLDQDHRVRHRVAERVADLSADDAGGGPRLSGDVRGVKADEGQRENDEDRGTAQAWEGPPPVLPKWGPSDRHRIARREAGETRNLDPTGRPSERECSPTRTRSPSRCPPTNRPTS